MKGLSLWQPYATFVAVGAKRYETRSWSTSYHGPLAIQAAKNFPEEYRRMLAMQEPFHSTFIRASYRIGPLKAPEKWIPLGAIVAVCDLVDCLRIPEPYLPTTWTIERANGSPLIVTLPPSEPERSFGNYEAGRFAWVLDNIRALPQPIPCRGGQRLWNVPTEIEQRLLGMLKGQ